MSDNRDIRNSINTIFQQSFNSRNPIIYGEVISISEDGKTCEVKNIKSPGGEIIQNVNIQISNGNQSSRVPELESNVILVNNLDDNQYYIFKTDEVNNASYVINNSVEITVTANDGLYKIDSPNINLIPNSLIIGNETNDSEVVFNGGSNDGLVKVKELTTKITQLEERVNYLINVLTTWVPVASDGGLALKTLWNLTPQSNIITTVQSDIENTLVKH